MLVFELVCHHPKAVDIVSIFLTCKNFSKLMNRTNLWSYILQRDFPDHYKLSKISKHKEWYQDLYKIGGYFMVYYPMPLFSFNILYISGDKDNIWTIRYKHDCTNLFIRLPGQNFVALFKHSISSYREILKLIPSHCDHEAAGDSLLVCSYEPFDSILYRLEKYHGSIREELIKWLNQRFISIKFFDNNANFHGILREEYNFKTIQYGKEYFVYTSNQTEYLPGLYDSDNMYCGLINDEPFPF